MKKDKKFDLWIDRSIDKLLELIGEPELKDSGESTSELSEIPIFQPLPPHAEASDFLSLNEWMETWDHSPPN